jgi:hypothetical protein
MAQINTDIFLCDFIVSENGIHCSEPLNITARKGYDNQPSFSNDGKRIYYSAVYAKTNDIYCYDIESKKNLTITNTPATSEFSPLENSLGTAITSVFIEKDSTTQRLWEINIKNRKEKCISPFNDSIGYYWPIDYGFSSGEFLSTGTSVRKVKSVETDYAVFVLGKGEFDHTLRIISPSRKNAKEKIIDDSVGRCIRQVPNDHFISYVKKTKNGNYLKFYDLQKQVIVGNFFMGRDNEDYVWNNKSIFFSNANFIIMVRFDKGYDNPMLYGSTDLGKYGIQNIKRLSLYKNKLAFVADDK